MRPASDNHLQADNNLSIRHLGEQDYRRTWQAMQDFTCQRLPDTPDEIWLLQHPPVFTLGLNGKPEHILQTSGIPLLKVDRGGQVTYHGPGQLVVYLLINLKNRGYGIRAFVRNIELAVIRMLADYGIHATGRPEAPGVYVANKKIAALGLRVKNHCTYHGLALNIDMDLTPFTLINPCGYPGQEVIDMRALAVHAPFSDIQSALIRHLSETI